MFKCFIYDQNQQRDTEFGSTATVILTLSLTHQELSSETRTRSPATDGLTPTDPRCQHHAVSLGLHEVST